MFGNRKRTIRAAALAVISVMVFMAASISPASSKKGEIELVYVEWATEVASTNVVKAVLEDAGYEVEITPVSAAAMWQAVATGDADGMVAAWLDTTHGHYLEAVKDKVEDLGPNLEGTRIGLVVPTYVTIDSIEDLNANARKFDEEIIGIDPGAGLMSKTEKVMEEYKLKDLELVEGSDATMIATLAGAVRDKKWIVVTGWTPHWMFSRWDLKYLDDPKKIYGGSERVDTIVRKGLKKDMPEAYRILDNFHWTVADCEELMGWDQEPGADPAKNARKWIEKHPDKVKAWLETK